MTENIGKLTVIAADKPLLMGDCPALSAQVFIGVRNTITAPLML